jgi:hypothetical protein
MNATTTVARAKARRDAGMNTKPSEASTDIGRRTTTAWTMSAWVGDPLMRAGKEAVSVQRQVNVTPGSPMAAVIAPDCASAFALKLPPIRTSAAPP